MESRTIIVNEVEVIAFSDGSIEKPHHGKGAVRTYGLSNGRGYLQVGIGGKANHKKVYIHRIIAEAFNLGLTDGKQVDHINGNNQDNRLENLRVLTNRENHMASRKKKQGCASNFRGVKRSGSKKNPWLARVQVGDVGIHAGCFTNEVDAALAYDRVAMDNGYFREALNFPDCPDKYHGK